jgi:hypothetical protein
MDSVTTFNVTRRIYRLERPPFVAIGSLAAAGSKVSNSAQTPPSQRGYTAAGVPRGIG